MTYVGAAPFAPFARAYSFHDFIFTFLGLGSKPGNLVFSFSHLTAELQWLSDKKNLGLSFKGAMTLSITTFRLMTLSIIVNKMGPSA